MVRAVPGRLILCATPIGNLGDAPPRLVETLARCDAVYAEDTRRARTLLSAIGVEVPVRSFFVGNERERLPELVGHLSAGRTVGLLTDAGTPGVSDPGVSAVGAAREAGADVSIVPGPSAVTSAVAVSGFGGDRFVFEGFLPRKGKERAARLEALVGERRTIVLFAVPQRVLEDLADLTVALGAERPVCVVRELTKLHEEVVWYRLGQARTEFEARSPRGEFTLVIAGAPAPAPDLAAGIELARELARAGETRATAARQAAARTGADRRAIYDALGSS